MSVLDRVRAALAGTILELEEARREATRELISFKAGEKLLAARADALRAAIAAGKGGAEAEAELASVEADRAEQASYARELLRGRRELDAKLQSLKLREGSVAAGIAATRPGGNPFATEGGAWDRFEDAERAIEDDAALAELSETELDETALAQQKLREVEHASRAEDALEALKRKMRGE